MRDDQIDLCGQLGFARGAEMPLLGREDHFAFACAACGGCCRGREDIVLSGYDLWRIAGRLRLPPRTVARGFCRGSIGPVSGLPVLRLAPVRAERSNCPFLEQGRCTIHDAEPLVCALYPLAQEISRAGEVRYFLQPTRCGGARVEGKIGDYLSLYGVLEREPLDVRWALTCLELEDAVAALALAPVLRRRMEAKLWQALYFGYDPARPWAEQLEANLAWLAAQLDKLRGYQQQLSIKKSDRQNHFDQ